MKPLVDIFFLVIFSLTSLLWWGPILGVLAGPFFLLRLIKRRLKGVAALIEAFSERKLGEFRVFRENIERVKKVEAGGKRVFQKITDKVYQRLVWWTRMEILENIPKAASVLDIGCGNGYLAKLVAEVKKAKVTCCDVANHNTSNFPTILYDGKHLPFGDREFDIVILSYVLHHSEIPGELLKEASRVCRGKIIIYEDEVPLIRNLAAKAHGRAYNFLYNQKGEVNYYSPGEWEKMFKERNLVIGKKKEEWGIGSLLIPFKKEIFVLTNKSQIGKIC